MGNPSREQLQKQRTTFLGEINNSSVDEAGKDLLNFALTSNEEARMIIDSGGGTLNDAHRLYDLINLINIPIVGIVVGNCMSAAVNVLQACTKRVASPHSWFLIHPLSSKTIHSFDEDFMRRKEEWERILRITHDQICRILARRTKRSVEEVDKMIKEGDRFMRLLSPQEALEIGLIDSILSPEEPLFIYHKREITELRMKSFL